MSNLNSTIVSTITSIIRSDKNNDILLSNYLSVCFLYVIIDNYVNIDLVNNPRLYLFQTVI